MFVYKSVREQLIETRRENERLTAQLAKAAADVEYIAMMSDIDIEQDAEDTEVENDE